MRYFTVLLLLFIFFSCKNTTEPSSENDPGYNGIERIIFGFSNTVGINIMDIDGLNNEKLLNTAFGATVRDISSDLTKIVFEGLNGAFLYNLQTDSVILYDHPVYSPRFTFDGTQVIFEAWETNGNHSITTMDEDGGNIQRLTDINYHCYYPYISPNGAKITFSKVIDGSSEVYIMDSDGSNQQRLTHDGGNYHSFFVYNSLKILYISGAVKRDTVIDYAEELFVMNLDGSNKTRLTFNGRAIIPDISSDGRKIVFQEEAHSSPAGFRISIIDLETVYSIPLTDFGKFSQPHFSKDDSKIVYDNNGNIWIMNTDGTDKIQLTNDIKYESWPDFVIQ